MSDQKQYPPAEAQASLKSLVRCHRDLWEREADVCICVELEREVALLASQLVGEAELFANLLQRILRFLPACALKQVVCLLLLKLEIAVAQYMGCSDFFLWETKGKENDIRLFRLYCMEKCKMTSCRK